MTPSSSSEDLTAIRLSQTYARLLLLRCNRLYELHTKATVPISLKSTLADWLAVGLLGGFQKTKQERVLPGKQIRPCRFLAIRVYRGTPTRSLWPTPNSKSIKADTDSKSLLAAATFPVQFRHHPRTRWQKEVSNRQGYVQ